MKIGINCQNLSTYDFAGVENYTLNLLSSLLNIDKENQYVLFFDKKPYDNLDGFLGKFNNCEIVVLPKFLSWTQVSLPLKLISKPVDIFFTPIHTLPILVAPFINTVAMIHGLEYKYNQTKGLFGLLKGWHEWFVIRMSKKLIVPSNFTKSQIIENYPHIDIKKISVIPEGVSNYFSKEKFSPDVKEKVISKFNIPNRYVLFVSTIQPRKNISSLIKAFAKVSLDPLFKDVGLVIAGKKGWDCDEDIVLPIRLNLGDKVKFLDRVSEVDLPDLYLSSSAFVSASLMEGFGLHLLEALRAGVPCAVSDIPSYKEIGRDCVLYHPPTDVDQICQNIKTLLTDSDYVESLRLRGYARSLVFYWDKTATETLEVFRSLANLGTK